MSSNALPYALHIYRAAVRNFAPQHVLFFTWRGCFCKYIYTNIFLSDTVVFPNKKWCKRWLIKNYPYVHWFDLSRINCFLNGLMHHSIWKTILYSVTPLLTTTWHLYKSDYGLPKLTGGRKCSLNVSRWGEMLTQRLKKRVIRWYSTMSHIGRCDSYGVFVGIRVRGQQECPILLQNQYITNRRVFSLWQAPYLSTIKL